ncbi:MAG: lysoplasmalogenase [Spirochaetota bacterium]
MNDRMMIFLALFSLFACIGVAVKCRKHKSYAVFKPIPMLMLIGLLSWVLLSGREGESSVFRLLILAGLVMGLAGDIFLLNAKKFFIQGLVSFLIGHCAYIAALIYASSEFSPAAAGAAVLPAVYFAYFYARIAPDTRKKFLPAIGAYFLVITVMTVCAVSLDLSRGVRLPVYGAAALVFCFSDALLAWTIFVKESVLTNGAVLASYYFAQLLFALAACSFI